MSSSLSKSLANVIPFGDVTVAENGASAALFKIAPEQAYAAGQLPIREIDVADVPRSNPSLVKSVRDRYWVPISGITVALSPLADVASEAANARTMGEISRALKRLKNELIAEGRKMTPEVWAKAEEKRIAKHVAARRKAGKEVIPKSMVFRPMPAKIHEETNYWTPVRQLIEWLQDPVGRKPPFTIFTEGSKKLPFFQWSTVPGATCPGAGKCWDSRPESVTRNAEGEWVRNVRKEPNKAYCYSLNGWRHVYPFLRQLQNTILTRMRDKSWIEMGLREVEQENPEAVVRLFVDGDFDSLETLEYWMHVCERYPRMRFYGYSKSWNLFLQWDRKHGGRWPDNYMLNLSNGTIWESVGGEVYAKMLDRMMGLRCTRGRFIAIPNKIGERVLIGSSAPEYTEKMANDELDPRDVPGWREHVEEVKQAAESLGIERPFVCPGKCFACLGPKSSEAKEELARQGKYGRHACGDAVMKGRNIVIAVH